MLGDVQVYGCESIFPDFMALENVLGLVGGISGVRVFRYVWARLVGWGEGWRVSGFAFLFRSNLGREFDIDGAKDSYF